MIGRSRTVRYSRRAISRTEASAGSRRSGWTRSTGASVGVLLVIGRSLVVARSPGWVAGCAEGARPARSGHGPELPGDELLLAQVCLLYTSDAADDLLCVDLGGRRIIKKKK